MNQTCHTVQGSKFAMSPDLPNISGPLMGVNGQTALLDIMFPGFSAVSNALLRYTKIDLSIYVPIFLILGLIAFASQYINQWAWEFVEQHLMSAADIRIDDEIYNMLMAFIADQQFAKKSRRFVANTNLNSRMWWLWRDWDDEDEVQSDIGVEFDEEGNPIASVGKAKQKKISFTPSFGTHYFWYKGKLLLFKRAKDVQQNGWGPVSEREEISIQCFGRNPTILKDLLDKCRADFLSHDENRTIIYRGGLRSGTSEPTWTRCVSRVTRPFSTVVLDETVKQNLLDDMRDYLHPQTRRYYSNRGIPYRRGYLLWGPPGTGKSSLSFAIAGYFKLKIYIVSLNSLAMNEENLGTLFTELPKQCVVLLEDIDTAGLTHTRDSSKPEDDKKMITETATPEPKTAAPGAKPNDPSSTTNSNGGRISLSALLNIIDGVAATEGRILIMTTNHLDKLDAALIRPGRVDMTVKFDLATSAMITTIFRIIFATLEGDIPKPAQKGVVIRSPKGFGVESANEHASEAEDEKAKKAAEVEQQKEAERIHAMGTRFAGIVPAMTFSPAEIQGYLLKYKREPEKAIENAAEWVASKTKEKKDKDDKEAKEKKEKEEEEKTQKETWLNGVSFW